MTPRRETSDLTRTERVLQFLHLGFTDYVGARTLLRAGLPIQGAVLGSTAIEKYFKVFAAARGNQLHGHLKSKHINLVRNFVPELFAKLNPEFLTFLQRCYDLRYIDQLAPTFNLTIFARETLAELDFSVHHCDLQCNLRRGDERLLTPYAHALAKKSPLVFEDNHLLLGEPKEAFLKRKDKAYSVRNRPAAEGGLLEVEFTVFESPLDGQFNREALKRVSVQEVAARAQESEREKP